MLDIAFDATVLRGSIATPKKYATQAHSTSCAAVGKMAILVALNGFETSSLVSFLIAGSLSIDFTAWPSCRSLLNGSSGSDRAFRENGSRTPRPSPLTDLDFGVARVSDPRAINRDRVHTEVQRSRTHANVHETKAIIDPFKTRLSQLTKSLPEKLFRTEVNEI